MDKETFEGLCSIINEMTAVRQKVQDELERRVKNYELPPKEITNVKMQMENNLDKITHYMRMKVDLRRAYEESKEAQKIGGLRPRKNYKAGLITPTRRRISRSGEVIFYG